MRRRTRLAAGVALLGAVAASAWALSPTAVLARLSWLAGDPVRLGAACLALALVRPLVAWPTTLLAVVVGYGYGPLGAPFALGLVVLTSVPPYAVARRTGTGRVADAGRQFVDAAGDVRTVTASRLLPAPSDVVSVGAGVARVPLSAFLLGTAVGETPWVVAGVLAGDSLGELAAGSPGAVFDLRLVAAAALVSVLLLAGPVYRYAAGRDVA